jgi:nucleoside-diphosphate-sugar epimerase
MKVLVTGTDGYIGAVVPEIVTAHGHEVTGVDTGFHRAGWLFHDPAPRPPALTKDIRLIDEEDLAGFDAVVHMAELSNDPVGQLDPGVTYEINHAGSVRLATLAKRAGVERFVYTSSCSVYGIATEATVTEESPTNPQTAYAVSKTLVERDLAALADDSFSPVFLRNATAYGASPRMRFDIVINNLSGLAWTIGEIRMESDGTPWRPFVHIRDIATSIACALDAPRELVHSEIYNVGSSDANYQIRDIAEIVGEVFTGCRVSLAEGGGPDTRSYRVSFDKINERLPGFSCAWDARSGTAELRSVFEAIDMSAETFEWRGYTRLKQIEHLRRTGQIDEHFYWTTRGRGGALDPAEPSLAAREEQS